MSTVWFMEGLSSQGDLLQGAVCWAAGKHTIIGSHSKERPEILQFADIQLHEPNDINERLSWMQEIITRHQVVLVHVGRDCRWYENHRRAIEAFGVQLITGALDVDTFELADDKAAFAAHLTAAGLNAVPAQVVTTPDALRCALENEQLLAISGEHGLCIKPVRGIYGAGFWRFRESSGRRFLSLPGCREIPASTYLELIGDTLNEPMLVMPYLEGPEASIDMVVRDGALVDGLIRLKRGSYQQLQLDGPHLEVGAAVAKTIRADGLINIQTRYGHNGELVVLEANLRPSGGVGFGLGAGVNLAGALLANRLGYPKVSQHLRTNSIRVVTTAITIDQKESIA